ncbi:Cytoplasmic glyoxalase II, partial [Coemansia sp. RSA 454]
MKVIPVPCLSDNYAYVLVDTEGKQVAVIDPVEPEKVLKHVEALGMELTALLTTHHHADHSAGNNEVAKAKPGLEIYGGDSRIPSMTKQLKDGEEFTLGSLHVRAIQTFGHTTSSICYYVQDKHNDERVV